MSYHDPFVPTWNRHQGDPSVRLDCVGDVYAAAADADLVILLQAHRAYDLARLGTESRALLDTRGALGTSDTVHRL